MANKEQNKNEIKPSITMEEASEKAEDYVKKNRKFRGTFPLKIYICEPARLHGLNIIDGWNVRIEEKFYIEDLLQDIYYHKLFISHKGIKLNLKNKLKLIK